MSALATRRLMSEYKQFKENPDENIKAAPVSDDNLFEWHFTIKGLSGSDFDGGHYHGKLVFPKEYPRRAPDIYFMTPNGRFETNKRLCLNFTSYHQEEWTSSWSIRTMLTAVIPFMITTANGAIGGIDTPSENRKKLAKESVNWCCKECHLYDNPEVKTTNN